jgi:hypothetical protein
MGKPDARYAVHSAAMINNLWGDRDFNRRAAGFFEAESLRA